MLELLLSLEANYFLTQNQLEVIRGKKGDVKSGIRCNVEEEDDILIRSSSWVLCQEMLLTL